MGKNNTGYSTKLISPNLGLEIVGVDISQKLTEDIIGELIELLAHHHLLIFRKQVVSENKFIEFSCSFGEPVPSLLPTFQLLGYPLISRHSNIKNDDDETIGAMAPEFFWHSDSYLTDNPNKATLLYSLISPREGGDTGFVNMNSAYEMLDNETKKTIAGRKAFYKNIYKNRPPVAHPLIRINSITHKKSLFVNKHRALGVENMPENEALDLLKNLYEFSIQPERIYKHKWQDGDFLIWDNSSTMHAATPISGNNKRLLYRILIKGELPIT